jgi:CBS domain-containing protein
MFQVRLASADQCVSSHFQVDADMEMLAGMVMPVQLFDHNMAVPNVGVELPQFFDFFSDLAFQFLGTFQVAKADLQWPGNGGSHGAESFVITILRPSFGPFVHGVRGIRRGLFLGTRKWASEGCTLRTHLHRRVQRGRTRWMKFLASPDGVYSASSATKPTPFSQGVEMGKQLTAGDICKRKVTVGYRQTSVVAAAQLMREDHVGSLVVVEEENGSRQVRGIVTDRDIVMSVVATGLDPEPLCLEDIMSERLVTASETDSLMDVMRAMREYGVRRVPVIGGQDELIGILTLNDALKIMTQEMNLLVGSIGASVHNERVRRH